MRSALSPRACRGTAGLRRQRSKAPPAAGRRARSRPAALAFTLVEVLVALVILSTGIVVVLEAFQTSLTALTRTREAMRMDMLARARLAEVRVQTRAEPPALPVDGSGVFEGEDAAYAWSQRVDGAAAGESRGRPVWRVTVSVWRRDGAGGRRSIALVLRPPPEEAP